MTAQANPFTQLLASAAARFQVNPADLETHLRGEIRFTKAFGSLTDTYDVLVAGHIIQLTPGQSAGCVSCTRAVECERGYTPGSIAKLVTCPAAAAACVRYVITRKWDTYGPAFEAWLVGAKAEEARTDELPQPLSPAALIAAELTSQHPELAARIEKALALAEAGTIEFDHYATGVMRETMTWRCDCPDATRRPQWTQGIGQTCKHCLAQYIAYRVKRDLEQAGQRKLIDGIERARRDQALPPDVGTGRSILDMLGYDDLTVEQQKARAAASLGSALRPDYINRKASHSAQFRGIGHL